VVQQCSGLLVETIFLNANGLVNGGRFKVVHVGTRKGNLSSIIRESQENEVREYSLKSDNLEDLISGSIFETDTIDDVESKIHELTNSLTFIICLFKFTNFISTLKKKGLPAYQGVKIEFAQRTKRATPL